MKTVSFLAVLGVTYGVANAAGASRGVATAVAWAVGFALLAFFWYASRSHARRIRFLDDADHHEQTRDIIEAWREDRRA